MIVDSKLANLMCFLRFYQDWKSLEEKPPLCSCHFALMKYCACICIFNTASNDIEVVQLLVDCHLALLDSIKFTAYGDIGLRSVVCYGEENAPNNEF